MINKGTHYVDRESRNYKYALIRPLALKTNIIPKEAINTPYLHLSKEGRLELDNGYSWDGATGLAIDTDNFMYGSLVHDAFYQLMRTGLLDKSCRKPADKLLRKLCLGDGMTWFRAWYVYRTVRALGGFFI